MRRSMFLVFFVLVDCTPPAERQGKSAERDEQKGTEKILTVGQVAEIDGMKFELLRGRTGKPRMVTSDNTEHDGDKVGLHVWFRIANATDDFVWRSNGLMVPKLKDEFGNTYDRFQWDSQTSDRLKGFEMPGQRVDPGQSFVSVVAFEMPLPKAQQFIFAMPSRCIGRDGTMILFKIPRSWFE